LECGDIISGSKTDKLDSEELDFDLENLDIGGGSGLVCYDAGS